MKERKVQLYTKKRESWNLLDVLIELNAFTLAFLVSIKMLGKRKALDR